VEKEWQKKKETDRSLIKNVQLVTSNNFFSKLATLIHAIKYTAHYMLDNGKTLNIFHFVLCITLLKLGQ
jgi:hypothetical protein